MVVYKKREVESSLSKKGFEKKNKDHRYYYLYVDGFDVGRHTKISHGSKKELTDFHIKNMARQIGINKYELIDVIKCPIDKDELVNLLRDKYHLIP